MQAELSNYMISAPLNGEEVSDVENLLSSVLVESLRVMRLGHKQRDAALEELDDRIDAEPVQRILEEIGYEEDDPELGDRWLTIYYTAVEQLAASDLRAFLSDRLPEAMIPASFVRAGLGEVARREAEPVSDLPMVELDHNNDG